MRLLDYRLKGLAILLCALAGYVDAIGFLNFGGFFVSFMSGNSTRLGVGLAQGSSNAAVALIGAFVIGVTLGSLTGRITAAHRRPVVLVLVSLLLAGAAGMGAAGLSQGAVAIMAIAMGAENAVFEEKGEMRIGLTYMTGTLVKIGQRIADAICGGDRLAWVPFLMLWAGLLAGAVAGAASYARLGLGALWIASAAAAGLALAASAINVGSRRIA